MKRLDLVVGSNGAGKTTIITTTLQPVLPASHFVNADEIARQRWGRNAEAHAYEASALAARTRELLVSRGDPLIAETDFSHPSKLVFVRETMQAGYTVVLHALLIPEELAVARVAARVRAGGHSVPEAKIRGRYARLWPQVTTAVQLVRKATVYDNSRLTGPRPVARFAAGVLIGASDWPEWTPTPLLTL